LTTADNKLSTATANSQLQVLLHHSSISTAGAPDAAGQQASK